MNEAINYIAMVLSVVSLIVTIVGFFASLKFYRDGVELQGKANDALTKLSEKTDFIQTQVGGMFDKTLDAAIGKRAALSENFEELSEQIEQVKTNLIEETVKQIGAAGEAERNRLSKVVDEQINLIIEKVDSTRETASDVMDEPIPFSPLSTLQSGILISLGGEQKETGRSYSEIISFISKIYPTVDKNVVRSILKRFMVKNWVKRVDMGSEERYILTEKYWKTLDSNKV